VVRRGSGWVSWGVAGLLIGIVGVGTLVGGFGGLVDGPSGTRSEALAGAGAILVGSVSYAVGGLYARRSMRDVPVTVSAVGQSAGGLVLVLPFAAFALPERLPSLHVLGALAGLGVIGTGVLAAPVLPAHRERRADAHLDGNLSGPRLGAALRCAAAGGGHHGPLSTRARPDPGRRGRRLGIFELPRRKPPPAP
jgi:hypothetical protein